MGTHDNPEGYTHRAMGWSAAINNMDFYECDRCGALVDRQGLSTHTQHHARADSVIATLQSFMHRATGDGR